MFQQIRKGTVSDWLTQAQLQWSLVMSITKPSTTVASNMSDLRDSHSIVSSITTNNPFTPTSTHLFYSSPPPHFRILDATNRPENATRRHSNAHATPYEDAQRLQIRDGREIANTHYQDISFQNARQQYKKRRRRRRKRMQPQCSSPKTLSTLT